MTEAADGEIGRGWILPDVVSRLRAAEILHLNPPNENERRAIVRAYFVARRMPVGENVLAWIETHAPRDLTSLGTLSAALLHEAERRKRRITLGLAREVLRSMPGSERGGDL
jgi:chromosomal replication initiation ATPase DnaA